MFITVNKKTVELILVLVLVVIALSGMIGGTIASVAAKERLVPIYSVDTDSKKIAISFDAAWGADKTKSIVDTLNKYQIKGTFFLVGFWIDKYAEEVKYISDNGMEIGNHSANHLKMSTIQEEVIIKEISSVNEKITAITGKPVKVFRPPFGDYNDRLIRTVNELGMKPIQWDVDSLDWKGLSSGEISKRVCSRVKSGSIILCHNNSDHIVEALPMIILNLKNQGYEFVTMSELVYDDNYIIDNNGVQHLKKMEE